jgi:hypothetical protein
MDDNTKIARQTLLAIYEKHRRKYRGNNSTTKQMCCMWSTNNPPDSISDTQPIYDIEKAFNINLDDEEEAMEIYDMTLDEAIEKIMQMKRTQN